MRAVVKFAVLPLALLAAAFSSVLAPSAGAAPPADVSGSYAGKLLYRFFPLTEADTPGRGNFPATMAVTFNAPMLSVIVNVQADGGPEVYNLQGRYGLGHFWATGNGPGGQMSLTGTVGGIAGRLKIVGAGSIVSVDTVNTIRVVQKQLPPL